MVQGDTKKRKKSRSEYKPRSRGSDRDLDDFIVNEEEEGGFSPPRMRLQKGPEELAKEQGLRRLPPAEHDLLVALSRFWGDREAPLRVPRDTWWNPFDDEPADPNAKPHHRRRRAPRSPNLAASAVKAVPPGLGEAPREGQAGRSIEGELSVAEESTGASSSAAGTPQGLSEREGSPEPREEVAPPPGAIMEGSGGSTPKLATPGLDTSVTIEKASPPPSDPPVGCRKRKLEEEEAAVAAASTAPVRILVAEVKHEAGPSLPHEVESALLPASALPLDFDTTMVEYMRHHHMGVYMEEQNGAWYHSANFVGLAEAELELNSEDELDDSWINEANSKLLDQFTDVAQKDKDYMKMWNEFSHKEHLIADWDIMAATPEFIRRYGAVLYNKHRSCHTLHLLTLHELGILKPNEIERLLDLARRVAEGEPLPEEFQPPPDGMNWRSAYKARVNAGRMDKLHAEAELLRLKLEKQENDRYLDPHNGGCIKKELAKEAEEELLAEEMARAQCINRPKRQRHASDKLATALQTASDKQLMLSVLRNSMTDC